MNNTEKLDSIRRMLRRIEIHLGIIQRTNVIMSERTTGGSFPPGWAVHDDEQAILAKGKPVVNDEAYSLVNQYTVGTNDTLRMVTEWVTRIETQLPAGENKTVQPHLAAHDARAFSQHIRNRHEGPISSHPLDVPIRILCPCCCTIDDILAIKPPPAAGALSQAVCARCAFTFPVLPPEVADLTLTAMREHDCLVPGERGNWDAVGREINGQVRLKGFSQEDLSRRFREQQAEPGDDPDYDFPGSGVS
jgi:hypothetical protein